MSKLLPILTKPSPILREISEEVKEDEIKSPKIKELFLDMKKTMREKNGVGLAAPQIGINKRIFVVKAKKDSIFFINPIVTKKSWAKATDEEGCLSIPGVYGKVKRHKKINCTFTDIDGKKRKIQATDFLARVIQHELDHLDGILFIDKMKDGREVKLD